MLQSGKNIKHMLMLILFDHLYTEMNKTEPWKLKHKM